MPRFSEESYGDEIGIKVVGISEIRDQILRAQDEATEAMEVEKSNFHIQLSAHIRGAYQINKNARRESDIEQEMLDSLYQVNMQYRTSELTQMKTGSKIYMGLTATKSRAARSWIKDLIQPSIGEQPFLIIPSPVVDLPADILAQIEEAFTNDLERLSEEIEMDFQGEQKIMEETPEPDHAVQEGPQPVPNQPPVAPSVPPPKPNPKPKSALTAVKKLKKQAELKRDIEASIRSEIDKVALADVKKYEKEVIDQLLGGGWRNAISDFIEDFTIYPTAFMKGPVVSTKVKLSWENGTAVPKRHTVFLNKRVAPLDVYPSPSAASIYDGNFIEHIRLTRKELSDLSFLDGSTGYKKANIIDVLTNMQTGSSSTWMDTEIEEDKQSQEKRGSQTYASEGIYHGAHFWGTAPVKMLKEWGYEEADLMEYEDHEEVEIEAILVGDQVVKCLINRDPLGRRPYYSASFQTRSGSLWGKSLPFLMRDVQRMCNACARALADNMGLSSGPQVGIIVDRLADTGKIEEMAPRKVWQFTSDPTGNSGKPIEFFLVPSNAKELLAVYDKFETKADDVTGVPRYAYGNENVGGAGQTASGLSMLLESASKGIKSSIKNISEGLIEPRVEYQFYLHLLNEMENNNPTGFTGDINVVIHGAEAITIKAAEAQLQKDLLQTTTNKYDMKILGMVGRGEILRSIFKGAGLPEDAIPPALDLKEQEASDKIKEEKQMAAMAEGNQAKAQVGLKATEIQAGAQVEMHKGTLELGMAKLKNRVDEMDKGNQLKAMGLQQKIEAENNKGMVKLQDTQQKITAEAQNVDRKLAVDVSKSKVQEI